MLHTKHEFMRGWVRPYLYDLQPTNIGHSCISMLTFNLARPVFVSIPCTKGMGDAFFCRLEENLRNASKTDPIAKVQQSNKYCSDNWIFVKGNCYKPILVNSGSDRFKLHSLCNKIYSRPISYSNDLLVLDSIMLQLSNLQLDPLSYVLPDTNSARCYAIQRQFTDVWQKYKWSNKLQPCPEVN